MKARRLPLLVDAEQWSPPPKEWFAERQALADRISDVVGCKVRLFRNGEAELVGTDSTVYELNSTDWIIRRTYADGTTCVYVISDEVFKRGYEIVPDTAATDFPRDDAA